MSERKTFFEQVPVETVKKLCQGKIYRSKERARREDTMKPPVMQTQLAKSEQAASQD